MYKLMKKKIGLSLLLLILLFQLYTNLYRSYANSFSVPVTASHNRIDGEFQYHIFLIITILLIATLAVSITLYVRRVQEKRHLEDMVKIRTAEIEKQNRVMRAVTETAGLMLTMDTKNYVEIIKQSTEKIGRVLDSNRVCIWQNQTKEDGRLYYTLLCTWIQDENAKRQMKQEYCYDDTLPRWLELFSQGGNINQSIDQLPYSEQDFLRKNDVLSVLAVPIIIDYQLWGFVCFDDTKEQHTYPETEEYVLRYWGMLIANAIRRGQDAVAMRETLMKLEAANRTKSAFLANMSHEIRTPLNVILGITDILLQKSSIPTEELDALNRIYNSGDLLLGIINDILDMSKIEAGKLDLLCKNYDVASLINDTVLLNMMRFEGKPITFRLFVDEELPAILLGDELRIKQILNNLLSNAAKYTKSGSASLTATFEPSDNSKTITFILIVKDSGQGMTKEQVEKLFDEYSRFNAKANQLIEGTGLGMSITHNLVKIMGGTISLESQPGIGSVFTVRLPQIRVCSETLGAETVENLQKFRKNGIIQKRKRMILPEPMPYGSVLVVDDMESNLYVAKGLLKPYDLTIDTVLSAEEALHLIDNGKVYDIIFMDHMMPKMDGVEATKLLRKRGYLQPIVALTADAIMGQSEMFLANGFDHFLAKPIHIVRLDEVLHTFIKNKQPMHMIEVTTTATTKECAISNTDPQMLEVVYHDIEKTLNILEPLPVTKFMQNEDLNTYIVQVHAMKNVLSHIGETTLSETAKMLEMAGRSKDMECISIHTPAFIDSLRNVFIKINPLPKTAPCSDVVSQSFDPNEVREKLMALSASCKELDIDAANEQMESLQNMKLNQTMFDLLAQIKVYLLHSDMDAITALIEQYDYT